MLLKYLLGKLSVSKTTKSGPITLEDILMTYCKNVELIMDSCSTS